MDVFFSADVETDGPIPGPYSALSFALVYAGCFDGENFERPECYETYFYREMRPISEIFQREALAVNGLNREQLVAVGEAPEIAMNAAFEWVKNISGPNNPVLVAYPVSFDWSWLYWYFTKFSESGSPFGHSQCFDIKTAYSVKNKSLMRDSGRSKLPIGLLPSHPHTHNALDDAIEQAEIFANVFELDGLCQKSSQETDSPQIA